jgi:hypothetical protein
MRWFYRGLPPQPPTGIHEDDDFRPSEPGVAERFVGWWNGHPVYREPAPKATFLRDPRAVRNEKLAAERRAARGDAGTSDSFLDDGPGPYNWDGRGDPI